MSIIKSQLQLLVALWSSVVGSIKKKRRMGSGTFVLIDFVKKITEHVFFTPFWTTQAGDLFSNSLHNFESYNLWITWNMRPAEMSFLLDSFKKVQFWQDSGNNMCFSKKSCFFCNDLLQMFALFCSERWFVFCPVLEHLWNLIFNAWFLCPHVEDVTDVFLLQGAQVWLKHKEQLLPSTVSSCDELSMVLTTEYGKVRHQTCHKLSLTVCVSYIKYLYWFKDERLCIFIPRPAKFLKNNV